MRMKFPDGDYEDRGGQENMVYSYLEEPTRQPLFLVNKPPQQNPTRNPKMVYNVFPVSSFICLNDRLPRHVTSYCLTLRKEDSLYNFLTLLSSVEDMKNIGGMSCRRWFKINEADRLKWSMLHHKL